VQAHRGPAHDNPWQIVSSAHLSGCPRIEHVVALPPAGIGGGAPDERQAKGRGLTMANWDPVWGESYFRFGFLDASWLPPDGGKPVRLFYPASICRSVTAFEDDTRAAAEMVFETPASGEDWPRTSLRVMRVAGDPWMYMRIAIQAGTGALGGVSLSALPFVYEWGDKRPHLELRRCVWMAGHDAVLEKNGDAVSVTAPAAPELAGGVFWYNRGSYRTGGNLTVFLPEEVESVSARWGWPVSVSFRPVQIGTPHVVLRLALYVWRDDAGHESGVEAFRRSLPARVRALRDVSFAWPVHEQFEPWERDLMNQLREADWLPDGSGRDALAQALDAYDKALGAVTKMELTDSDQRFATEHEVFVQRDRAREAVRRLLPAAMERGWPLAEGVDAVLDELEEVLLD
jgi:hypothetical protein